MTFMSISLSVTVLSNIFKFAFQDLSCSTRRGYGNLNNFCGGAGCADFALIHP